MVYGAIAKLYHPNPKASPNPKPNPVANPNDISNLNSNFAPRLTLSVTPTPSLEHCFKLPCVELLQ